MAKYTVNSDHNVPATMADIKHAIEIWNRDAKEEAVGKWDAPPSSTIGGNEAILRIDLRGRPVTIRCDSQRTFTQNLRCCFLALDDMRMNERRGIAETMREAYAMLAAPVLQRDPYEVLGVRSDMPIEDLEQWYALKAKRLHPDTNAGKDTTKEMAELNDAMDRIRKERGQ